MIWNVQLYTPKLLLQYSKELGSYSLGGVVKGWEENVLVGHFEVKG